MTAALREPPGGWPEKIEAALRSLACRRPLFHSEADFQHELAWEIRKGAPDMRMRLECPFPGRTAGAIDLMLSDGESLYAVELKYLSRLYQREIAGEEFKLKNHGAYDHRSYDVCKDITRVEEFCRLPRAAGSVIVLTNDSYYWRERTRVGTCAAAFDISDGGHLTGALDWAAHTGAGTKKNRQATLHLDGHYRLSWQDYSDIGGGEGRFRYLHIAVGAAVDPGEWSSQRGASPRT